MSETPDAPFSMLNALWFKSDGGAEKYQEYLAAAHPFMLRHGGSSDRGYFPEESLIGEFDADMVFFVDWPSQEAFQNFIEDPEYQAIRYLREEAITDSLLIRCKKAFVKT